MSLYITGSEPRSPVISRWLSLRVTVYRDVKMDKTVLMINDSVDHVLQRSFLETTKFFVRIIQAKISRFQVGFF